MKLISCTIIPRSTDFSRIIDSLNSQLRELYAEAYFKLRKEKGITYDMAYDIMFDVSYYGTMMVHLNHADGMVSGAVHTTQHIIRPAFQIIKTQPGTSNSIECFFYVPGRQGTRIGCLRDKSRLQCRTIG